MTLQPITGGLSAWDHTPGTSKSFLVPHTQSKWSAFIIHDVVEGAVAWPALCSTAHLLFLLQRLVGGGNKWKMRISGFWWGVPCQPLSSHHAALMPTVPSNEQGRGPCGWKGNGKWNLISPPVVFCAGGSERKGPWPDQTAVALNAWGGGKKRGIRALAAGAKREGGGMKGLRAAAGSCSAWLGQIPLWVQTGHWRLSQSSAPLGAAAMVLILVALGWTPSGGMAWHDRGEKRAGRKQNVPCEEGQPEERNGQQALKRKKHHRKGCRKNQT